MDEVNSPPHYKGEIECIDAMVQVFGEEAVKSYCIINHFKYLWRHRYKGHDEQDMAKADWYWRFSQGDDPRKAPVKPNPRGLRIHEEGRLV